ncbi:MAG: hypothetical protein SVT52_07675 [Planctomycetota bacterium]|nr:hypothetical protein [Planctomycetota bacterium]
MSLINEALKRAEEDKLRNMSEAPAHLAHADDETRGSGDGVPAELSKRGRRRKRAILGLVGIVLAFGLWQLEEKLIGQAEFVPGEVCAKRASRPTAEPKTTKPPDKTQAAAEVAKASAVPAHTSPPAGTRQKQAPRRQAEATRLVQTTQPVERSDRPVFAKGARGEPANFKLSGIMHGPDGKTAIINGYPVRAGDDINGAKVISIDQYSVELQVEGKSFFIRI